MCILRIINFVLAHILWALGILEELKKLPYLPIENQMIEPFQTGLSAGSRNLGSKNWDFSEIFRGKLGTDDARHVIMC